MKMALVLGCAIACTGGQRSAPIDPARFAPQATWTFAIPPAAPTPVSAPTRDQMIEDIAYLEHALDVAWAWQSRATPDTFKALPARLHEVPLRVRDGRQLCAELAERLRTVGVVLELNATPCRLGVAAHAPVPSAANALDVVPQGRNYQLRLDRQGNQVVGVLTVSRFVDPADDGWRGFDAAMKQLAGLELVILDMQAAGGDDPRAGFAMLAALGLENYARAYLQPASFRDNELARTARENARGGPASRDRALWSSFPTADDVMRIAREVVPRIERRTPLVAIRVLSGPGCKRACQLVIGLAQWQNIEVYGSFENELSGDEHGAIRLPHSGIVVTFPTASYGPYMFGGTARPYATADHGKTLLAELHVVAQSRAESFAWRTRKLPDCAKLPIDLAVFDSKAGTCRRDSVNAGVTKVVTLSLAVEASTAKRFLATCPGLQVQDLRDVGIRGGSSASVAGTEHQLAQALGAPFVQHLAWPCPVHPD